MFSIVYVRLRIQHPHGGSGFWALVICMTNFNLWCFLNPAESYIYDTFNFEGSCVNLRCSGQHARLYCTLAQTNPMHSFCAPRFLTYANNRPRTQQSHFRGDYRTLKTSTSVSDLQTHKVWDLGKTLIELPALEKYLSCYPNTQTAKKNCLDFHTRFILITQGQEFIFNKNIWYRRMNIATSLKKKKNNEGSKIRTGRVPFGIYQFQISAYLLSGWRQRVTVLVGD